MTFILALIFFSICFILSKKRFEKNHQISQFFDPDVWVSQNVKELDETDILWLENKITFAIERNLIVKGSVLYYLLKRGNGYTLQETKEERVIRLLKKDFEKNNCISFDEFMKIFNDIKTNKPEKLI